jgi:hypothetical protein
VGDLVGWVFVKFKLLDLYSDDDDDNDEIKSSTWTTHGHVCFECYC